MSLIPINVTIPSGAAGLSAAVNVDGELVGIQMPGDWVAAALTLEASADGNQFWSVENSAGTEVSLTVEADRYYALDPAAHKYKHLKLRSGTLATPVNQTADRLLVLLVRR